MAANEAYERWRATARDTKGRVLKGNSKPYTPPELPEGVINLSDPDSRVMRTQGTPPRQAYNAQAAVNDRQVILAAEISIAAPDFGHLGPMLDTTLDGLRGQGVTRTPEVVLADAGYWHTAQVQHIAEQGIEDAELVSPLSGRMVFRGADDLRVLLTAVYGSMTGLHWHTEVGDGNIRVIMGEGKVGGFSLGDAMVLELGDDGRIRRIRPHLRPWLALTMLAMMLGPKVGRHPGLVLRALRAA